VAHLPQRRADERGTRFRIYVQQKRLRGFGRPEIVHVRAAPGSIGPGPADAVVHVVDADDDKPPYRTTPGTAPPYLGPRHPAAAPGPGGHFDHLQPGTRAFSSAMAYAAVRRVLEIWEGYFGHPVPWYLPAPHTRLEVIPRLDVDNSFTGDGFLEFGRASRANLYCENFDAVAHEVGHLVSWGVIGNPIKGRALWSRAHDEAAADLVAIVASLSFDSVVNRLLAGTRGNLFSPNELSRVGELGRTRQIRTAFNYLKLSDVRPAPGTPLADAKYPLAEPFTAGAFDILVELYEQGLVARGAIPRDLADRSWKARGRAQRAIQREFARHFARKRARFRAALVEARDYFGRLLARTWDRTALRGLTYPKVVRNMLAADMELGGGRARDIIRGSFQWREILP
jgi:hypothetical protein